MFAYDISSRSARQEFEGMVKPDNLELRVPNYDWCIGMVDQAFQVVLCFPQRFLSSFAIGDVAVAGAPSQELTVIAVNWLTKVGDPERLPVSIHYTENNFTH